MRVCVCVLGLDVQLRSAKFLCLKADQSQKSLIVTLGSHRIEENMSVNIRNVAIIAHVDRTCMTRV